MTLETFVDIFIVGPIAGTMVFIALHAVFSLGLALGLI